MNPDQTAPGSSLIWVYNVCNNHYLRTLAGEVQLTKVVTGGLSVKTVSESYCESASSCSGKRIPIWYNFNNLFLL